MHKLSDEKTSGTVPASFTVKQTMEQALEKSLMKQERIQNYETEETEEIETKLIWHSSVKFHDPVLNISSVFCQTV